MEIKHAGDKLAQDFSNIEFVSEACENYRGDAGNDLYNTLSGGNGSGKDYAGSEKTASDLFDALSS